VVRSKEDAPAEKKHFTDLLKDMLGVVDRHLTANECVPGQYSVADISMYPARGGSARGEHIESQSRNRD